MKGVCFLLVGWLPVLMNAVPGIYKSKTEIENSPLSYVSTSVYQTLKKDCHKDCIKDNYCEAYAVSYFLKTCELFNQTIGFEEPVNPKANLYVKLKDESEGYFRVGTNYYKMELTQMDTSTASEKCASQFGVLASDTTKEVHKVMVKEMKRRSIWRVWLGWNSRKGEGEWEDAEGQAMNADRWAELGHWPSFTRICTILKYGQYEAKSEWTHEVCGNHHYFFCKIPLFTN